MFRDRDDVDARAVDRCHDCADLLNESRCAPPNSPAASVFREARVVTDRGQIEYLNPPILPANFFGLETDWPNLREDG